METTDPVGGRGPAGDGEPEPPRISAYSTSQDRTVFTESDNGDGWIATDHTVEPEN
jgi:hypothetical protein